jgi:hypothetical protein
LAPQHIITQQLLRRTLQRPVRYSTNVVIQSEAKDSNKFSRIQSALFDQRKEINPGGHAKLSGISVTEKL